MERTLPEKFQWLRNISILVIRSAETNTKNTHPHNRRRNADNVENLDSANNVHRSSRTRNPPIRFGEPHIH